MELGLTLKNDEMTPLLLPPHATGKLRNSDSVKKLSLGAPP